MQAQTFEQLVVAYERKDYRAAYPRFKHLAEQGDAKAQCSLGVINENGRGMPKNEEQLVSGGFWPVHKGIKMQ